MSGIVNQIGSRSKIVDGNVGIGTNAPTSLSYGTGATALQVEGATPVINLHATGTGSPFWEIAAYNQELRISDDGTNRMIFDSIGHVGINTATSADTQLFVKSSASALSYGIVRIQTPGTSSACDAIMFQDGDGDICGKIVMNMSSNVLSITYTSDYRLKENVIPMNDGITKIKALKPKYFNIIKDPDKTVFGGFLAHEVQDIVPEAIFGEKDAMKTEEYEVTPAVEEVRDADGNITTEAIEAVMGEREVVDAQSIDTGKLIPTIIGALQEAIARIEVLESA